MIQSAYRFLPAFLAAVLFSGCESASHDRAIRGGLVRPKDPASGQPFSAQALEDRGLTLRWTYQQTGNRAEESRIEGMYLTGADPTRPDTLYFQTENHWLHAIDVSSGTPFWMTRELPAGLRVAPAQTDKNLFLAVHQTLYVFDVERKPARIERIENRDVVTERFRPSGEHKYRLPLDFSPSTPGASNNDFVAFGTASGDLYSLPIYRIDQAIGKGAPPPLYASLVQWKHPTGSRALAPIWCPRTAEDASSSGNHLVVAYENGRILKCLLDKFIEADVGVWEFTRGGRAAAGPFVHAEHVFLGSLDGHLYVLDVLDGSYRGSLALGGPITTTPVVAGGEADHNRPDLKSLRIYVQVDKAGDEKPAGMCRIRIDDPAHVRNIHTFRDADDKVIENATLKMTRWLMSPQWKLLGHYRFVSQGPRTLYLLDMDSLDLVAVDPDSGEVRWRLGTKGIDFALSDPTDPFHPALAADAGRIVLGTRAGQVYCFQER